MSKQRDCLPCVQRSLELVADYFGVTPQWIMADSKTKTRVRCRCLAMALAQENSELTLLELAEEFGYADHTSIIHGVKKAKADKSLSVLLNRVEPTPLVSMERKA